MKKVIIIGSGGAGKSTLARRLGPILGIDVIHLDTIYWRAGWQPMPDEEWTETVTRLTERDSWIMDGNFGGTRAIRMAACDTIIFLDIPRLVCLARVFKRLVIYRQNSRPDIAEGCYEKLDREFLKWVWNFPKRKPRLMAEIAKFPEKNLFILRSDREIEAFIRSLEESRA